MIDLPYLMADRVTVGTKSFDYFSPFVRKHQVATNRPGNLWIKKLLWSTRLNNLQIYYTFSFYSFTLFRFNLVSIIIISPHITYSTFNFNTPVSLPVYFHKNFSQNVFFPLFQNNIEKEILARQIIPERTYLRIATPTPFQPFSPIVPPIFLFQIQRPIPAR